MRTLMGIAAATLSIGFAGVGPAAPAQAASTYTCSEWKPLSSLSPNIPGAWVQTCLEKDGAWRRADVFVQNNSAGAVYVSGMYANVPSLGGEKTCTMNSWVAVGAQLSCSSAWVSDAWPATKDSGYGRVDYWDPVAGLYRFTVVMSPESF
ncbi:hypothetical protein [Streptomyces sp. NPDC002952]|uniref:hypothetical protein n=1 Tax=Streptomyces sp. NPDC002952 TaxID=3364673 RepID=UPI003693EA99